MLNCPLVASAPLNTAVKVCPPMLMVSPASSNTLLMVNWYDPFTSVTPPAKVPPVPSRLDTTSAVLEVSSWTTISLVSVNPVAES